MPPTKQAVKGSAGRTSVIPSAFSALVDNIGITGHSQGGYEMVSAITDQKHRENYQAAVILSSAPLTILCGRQTPP